MDRLTDRIFAIVGSTVGTAASTCRAIAQAEQQSTLEDLARQYEADGKPALAENLRRQAAQISNRDPASDGAAVLELMAGIEPQQPLLGLPPESDCPEPPSKGTRRRRRMDGPLPAQTDLTSEQDS